MNKKKKDKTIESVEKITWEHPDLDMMKLLHGFSLFAHYSPRAIHV